MTATEFLQNACMAKTEGEGAGVLCAFLGSDAGWKFPLDGKSAAEAAISLFEKKGWSLQDYGAPLWASVLGQPVSLAEDDMVNVPGRVLSKAEILLQSEIAWPKGSPSMSQRLAQLTMHLFWRRDSASQALFVKVVRASGGELEPRMAEKVSTHLRDIRHRIANGSGNDLASLEALLDQAADAALQMGAFAQRTKIEQGLEGEPSEPRARKTPL